MKLLRIAALVALSLAIAGCPASSTMTTARSLDKGKFQGWVAPGMVGISAGDSSGATDLKYSGSIPNFEFGFRYGVADTMDLGLKLGASGATADYKWNFMRAETSDSGLDLSVDPTVGYSFAGISLALPVLVGINFSGHQLVLGPKIMDVMYGGSFAGVDTGANVLYGGGSVGVSFKLGESFRLLPEFSIAMPLYSSWETSAGGVGVSGSNSDPFNLILWQAGLGLMFGG